MNGRRFVMSVVAGVGLLLVPWTVTHARADTAPNLTCGAPPPDGIPGPCNQTAHFSDVVELGTPLPPDPSCPAFLSHDFFLIVGSGNGIEHATANKAQDGWFTSTFTGTVTATAYAPGQVDLSDPNNPVLIPNAVPDPSVAVRTGKVTEWFGGSFNAQNMVIHDTITAHLTSADGQSLDVHAVSHFSTTPGSGENPQRAFDSVNCS